MEGDDVDKDTVFPELELWDGRNGKLSGTYHIQPGYKGKLTAKVYNVYQLDGISNSVDLIPDEEAPDDAEDNAVIDDGVADEEDTMFLDEVKEEAAEDWVIGGNLPAIDTSAVANAIDKNTRSTVKDSYTGLLIAVLIGLVTVTVGTVLAIMSSAEKRRKKRRREGGGGRDVFDWAEDYDKD